MSYMASGAEVTVSSILGDALEQWVFKTSLQHHPRESLLEMYILGTTPDLLNQEPWD